LNNKIEVIAYPIKEVKASSLVLGGTESLNQERKIARRLRNFCLTKGINKNKIPFN
jgi:hypothetical protein